MKVLLLKDVYKLGRAGDVKKVADGYGRNFLLPQGLAVLATAGALKQAESIREKASLQRDILNKEMSGVAEKLNDQVVMFPAKASETGKLYGSVTTQMIADAISKKIGVEIQRRQIDTQPIRVLGDHKVHVRLTVDLVPTIRVVVFREGEAVAQPGEVEPVVVGAAPESLPEPEEEAEAAPEAEAVEEPAAEASPEAAPEAEAGAAEE